MHFSVDDTVQPLDLRTRFVSQFLVLSQFSIIQLQPLYLLLCPATHHLVLLHLLHKPINLPAQFMILHLE